MTLYSNNHLIDYKDLSTLTTEQLPAFILEIAPNLNNFLMAYFEWLDQEGNANYELRNLRNYRDIDRTLDKFIDWFHDEFMLRIPKSTLTDRRFLAKHIKQVYRAKGSQQAYKFLFKVLFNEDIDFYYPGVDILRASDGRWVVDRSITVETSTTQEGETVLGESSGARGRVERISETIVGGTTRQELFLSKILGDFESGEFVSQNGTTIGQTIGVTTYPGYYDGTFGFLSWDKFLQDNFYYQEFSYEIISSQTFDRYKDLAKKLLHPSGTILFNRYRQIIEIETLRPLIDTRVTIGTSAAYLFNIEIYAPDDERRSVANNTLTLDLLGFADSANTSNTWWTANSGLLSSWDEYTVSEMGNWKISTFTNGTGILGDNTLFETELAQGNTVKIVDTLAAEANSYNTIRWIQSNTNLILQYAGLQASSNGVFQTDVF